MTYTFDLTPIGKPRMTRSDKWKQRKCVLEYRAFCDELRRQALGQGFTLPDAFTATCYLPMPPSWSKAKRERMMFSPHQQKPDADNIAKALMDALLKDDSRVYDLRIRKFWSNWGRIEIEIDNVK